MKCYKRILVYLSESFVKYKTNNNKPLGFPGGSQVRYILYNMSGCTLDTGGLTSWGAACSEVTSMNSLVITPALFTTDTEYLYLEYGVRLVSANKLVC